MKILFVNDDLLGGGKQRRLVQLIRGLHADPRLELHLVLLHHSEAGACAGREKSESYVDLVDFPEIWSYNVKIHVLERKQKRDPSVIFSLRRLIKILDPDVVNVWSVMGCVYLLSSLLGLKYPVVSSFVADCNGPRKFSMWWWLIQAGFLKSTFITGNSKAGLLAYRAIKKKSDVIYNGFDFSRFDGASSKETMRQNLGIKTNYAVAMTSRFDNNKDYSTFLDAMILLSRKRSDVSTVCIGQGPLKEVMEQRIPADLKGRFFFTGFRRDVESILNACDLSVLCTNSKVHGEGISNSILEGMAAGHPVLATNSGGSPEIIVEGVTGYLLPPFDAAYLFEKVNELLEDPLLMAEMGRAARARIEEQFSLARMTNDFQRVFAIASRKGFDS